MKVEHVIEEVTGVALPLTPTMALLGIVDGWPIAMRRLVGLLLILAKRRVAVCWGRGRAQCESDWLRDAVLCQEQLTVYWELGPGGSRLRGIIVMKVDVAMSPEMRIENFNCAAE
ncbi:hypothetical protein NDU88_004446 [Pleurodeles waltl]|uniref:Uncharacterized protein n=1 Tax=Pleurodeles waltl TaxID=8319 RepID=A0AAV7L0C5_PLEWA|nr:hypothetical protein NDU88_004446 [Pleurodeles waltl]